MNKISHTFETSIKSLNKEEHLRNKKSQTIGFHWVPRTEDMAEETKFLYEINRLSEYKQFKIG